MHTGMRGIGKVAYAVVALICFLGPGDIAVFWLRVVVLGQEILSKMAKIKSSVLISVKVGVY